MKSFIEYIYNIFDKIPYYRDNHYSIHKEWETIPIICKETIRNNLTKFIDPTYREKIYEAKTSGSTGEYLTIGWKYPDYYRSIANTWRQRRMYGIKPSDNCVTDHAFLMNRSGYPSNYKIILNNNVLSLSKLYLDEQHMEACLEAIMKFNPRWFQIQPVFAYSLAKYCSTNNIKIPSLSLVELTGEMLPDNIKQYIYQVFKVPVVNHYGMQEFNSISYEALDGKNLILEDNVYVEILNQSGQPCSENQEGNIVVTSLTNTFMPLVRYQTNDVGFYQKTSYDKRALILTKARTSTIVNMHGKKLDPSIFFYLTERLNRFNYDILKFQYLKRGNTLQCNFITKQCVQLEEMRNLINNILIQTFDLHFEKIDLKFSEQDFHIEMGEKRQYYFELE